MSSLQKFHRRTLVAGGGAVTWPPTAIGDGDATNGFWVAGSIFNTAIIIAPKSTEAVLAWGSQGTVRSTTNTTNGLPNTNTLYAFGSAAHPAAYHAKSLTTGGYNTWYLPARDEQISVVSNSEVTPFATANGLDKIIYTWYWTSTEMNGNQAFRVNSNNGGAGGAYKNQTGSYSIRPIRRYQFSITTMGQGVGAGTDIVGYWLGTAGDGVSKLIVAPKSTEVQRAWGSQGVTRNAISTTNGVANTTTLFGFGSVAHPAAYYAKSLTTGGYNTWYLPARNELNTLYSNKSAVPFATSNSFNDSYHWSSTAAGGYSAFQGNFTDGSLGGEYRNYINYIRAVRRG